MDKDREPEQYMNEVNAAHLEPRVARLEVGLETLTRNVSEMATSIRENATTTNTKIDQLAIAVTQAAAPKKTDWGLLISGIGLVLALGAAVLIPLNNATNDNKIRIESYHTSMIEHQKLDMHPVGMAKVEALIKDVDINRAEMAKRDEQLYIKIQKETQLMTDLVTAKLTAMDQRLQVEMGLKNDLVTSNQKNIEFQLKAHEHADDLERKLADAELRVVKEKNDLFLDKLYGRVVNLENERVKLADEDRHELQMWRQKNMGLSSPDKTVSLISKDVPEKK